MNDFPENITSRDREGAVFSTDQTRSLTVAAHRSFARRRFAPRGFTLIELMISIALVLVLMIGINKVFKLTTDTVGAGQTLSAAVRDSRAAQAVYSADFGTMAQDAPFLLIRSSVTPAFRN